MKTFILLFLLVPFFTIPCSSQQKNTEYKGLRPSHSRLPNYDYSERFDNEPKDNLASLVHNMHISLMLCQNGDSTRKSRPIVLIMGEYAPIESLVNYKQSDVDKIEIEFIPQDILAALYGTSSLYGYGFIKIQLKEKK